MKAANLATETITLFPLSDPDRFLGRRGISHDGRIRKPKFSCHSPSQARGRPLNYGGMDLSPSRITETESQNDKSHRNSNMATLTIRNSSSMLPSPQEIMQNERYSQFSSIPLRSRSSGEHIALPSIRQAVPEIELGNARSESSEYSSDRASYSPIGSRNLEKASEHDQLEALSKRRRVSSQEGQGSEHGEYPLSRMFSSPQQGRAQSIVQSPTERYPSGYFAGEAWSQSSREMYQTATLPAMRLTPKFETSSNDFRPTLPSLPSLTLERGVPRGRPSWSDYALDGTWSGAQSNLHRSGSTFSAPLSASSSSQPSEYFTYEQQRGQSYSGPSIHGQLQMSDRSPFISRDYYTERPGAGDAGGMEATKHRKRRGNLPKETTDKLRAWFVAHLHHPYPTEDEKQELMRQTRLQMNQISNWFINARRRQLPAMISNARVESDARSAQVNDATPRADDSVGQDKQSVGLGLALESGSEGGYEDDLDSPERLKSSDSSTGLATKTKKGSVAGFGFGYDIRGNMS